MAVKHMMISIDRKTLEVLNVEETITDEPAEDFYDSLARELSRNFIEKTKTIGTSIQ